LLALVLRILGVVEENTLPETDVPDSGFLVIPHALLENVRIIIIIIIGKTALLSYSLP
jgi:hypothetical protein